MNRILSLLALSLLCIVAHAQVTNQHLYDTLPTMVDHYHKRLAEFKKSRSSDDVKKAIDALAKSANTPKSNVFEHVVAAADVGVTHGEICSTLRKELGFGHPLTVV